MLRLDTKEGSLIATEPTHRCACLVVRKPEDEDHMLWKCPQRDTLRRDKQAPSRQDRLAWPRCTSRSWADAGMSAQPLLIGCKTLVEKALADARFDGEMRNINEGCEIPKGGLWSLLQCW